MRGQFESTLVSGFDAIALDQLAKGMYMVKLQSENGYVIKKLIKQ